MKLYRNLTRRRKVLFWVLSPFVALVLYLVISSAMTSDFDRFAKQTIREYGHRNSERLINQAMQQYLEDSSVEDLVSFFDKNMGNKYTIDADDPNLNSSDKNYVDKPDLKRLNLYLNKYFNRGITSYEFRVLVYEMKNGHQTATSYVRLQAP